MARSLHPKSCFEYPDRRSFLWSLASLGLTGWKSNRPSETVYRFSTPECEIEMRVQYFAKSATNSFHFRDRLTNRAFCLSADGEEKQTCVERFTGSIAIARYRFDDTLPERYLADAEVRGLSILNMLDSKKSTG